MTKYIAVAGKGGVGKTTFTALLLRQMVHRGNGISVLAVDADPNANLGEALGLTVTATISDLLEQTKDPKAIPNGMSKQIFIEYKLSQALVETKDIDLFAMGGPQGAGCYCYANDLLRKYIETTGENYDFVVVDSEAGLEHISRRTIPRIDEMFVISDSSARGVRSAGRVHELIRGLKSAVGSLHLIVTKSSAGSMESLSDEIERTGLTLIGDIPLDPMVVEYDLAGKPLYDLPDDAVAVKAVESILNRAGIFN
ncbi:anaerobic carbon-monoxide dehydrogenase/CO-methylating acetyl-CoA synthase accessory protein AcsF [Candidatus Desulfosporosinus infrequens]|uniref:Anaerobic carbon-monoxide dehydrogenase/CO-methylating acetyl-CoA synthase accessory protein AcsF n=1 Tax=Candidatus Desulfosporosinus infrequens TaxID=2043169 RepID=A0A2U3LDU2_9FIRM|nr:anaerobic carbon-monoxide dehydrogenase/CO-methylating acetyl-CoA synthase accessory protein AcsF [Candidatus Desulfosporosinus infrequens]